MKLFELHTTLSERHRQIIDSFAQKKEYGNHRRVLERALELLEASDKVDLKEALEDYRIRKSLLELFGFILINRELTEGLTKVILGQVTMEKLFEKIREYAQAEFKTALKFYSASRTNSFQDMTRSINFYSKYLNILEGPHVNEAGKQVFAKLNAFKSMPEIPLEILNTLLEASACTFDLKLENEILVFTWIPPENYSEVKEKREKYLSSRREALIAKTK